MKKYFAALFAGMAMLHAVACTKISVSMPEPESKSSEASSIVDIYLITLSEGSITEYRKRISSTLLQRNQEFACEATEKSQTYVVRFGRESDGRYSYFIGRREDGKYQSTTVGWTHQPESPKQIVRVFDDGIRSYRVFLNWDKPQATTLAQRKSHFKTIDCVVWVS